MTLEQAIAWLEDIEPGRDNWDAMRGVIVFRNKHGWRVENTRSVRGWHPTTGDVRKAAAHLLSEMEVLRG